MFQNRNSLETIVKNIETKYPKDKVLKEMEGLFGKENTNILQNTSPELFLEKSINYYNYYKR